MVGLAGGGWLALGFGGGLWMMGLVVFLVCESGGGCGITVCLLLIRAFWVLVGLVDFCTEGGISVPSA